MKKMTSLTVLLLMVHSLSAQVIKSNRTNIYRRSSIYSLMLDNVRFALEVNTENTEMIKDIFLNAPLPEKFDDHNLTERIIPTDASSKRRSKNALRQRDLELEDINHFFEANQVAKKIVAKWFNRDSNGAFNTSLIEQRGFYDASSFKIDMAHDSARGLALLGDAGEELINNTFIIVNSYEYFSLEAAKFKLFDYSPNSPYKSSNGYLVFVKTFLFQLDWNKDLEQTFYNEYWCDSKTVTPAKVKAFDESNIFKIKYLGFDFKEVKTKERYNDKSSFQNCIQKATINTMDEVIVELQKKFDAFKTKTALTSVAPLTAKIGLKEGVTKNTIFEVLEQEITQDGKLKFNVIGKIGVDPQYPIWDNRFAADEENQKMNEDKTHFVKLSGEEFQPGMLIVQKKEKD